ncbi:MAG: Mur ligase family protein [bacterium]
MKKFFISILTQLATGLLRFKKPAVVAVAGSVGKTSTKVAIGVGLQGLSMRVGAKNFNNEIGVPLAIIGAKRYVHGIWSAVGAILRAVGQYFRFHWPRILVLELAADHPGDLDPLIRLAKPTVGVLTAITPEHLEFFKDLDAVAKEERKIISQLPKHGTAVINLDDPLSAETVGHAPCKVVTYGWHERADVRASDYQWLRDVSAQPIGIQAKVHFQGNVLPIRLKGAVGKHQFLPILAAVAVGAVFGRNALGTIRLLENDYQPPVGRMRLVEGLRGTVIIDDSYNSSPAAAEAAIRTLAESQTIGRKIAVLGEMRELGAAADEAHQAIGKMTARLGINLLVAVGDHSEQTVFGARSEGMLEEKIVSVPDPLAAGQWLISRIKEEDIILVKGSQGARMEKTVKLLMADQSLAQELLPRQTEDWLDRP